jgi:hypothetical protein
MNNPERDTKYQSFAKLSYDEMKDAIYAEENNDPVLSIYRDMVIEAAKTPVHVLDHTTLPIGPNIQTMFIKVEYDGKQYIGMLYPMKDEESNA